KIWDAATGECQQTVEGQSIGVTSVAFSADGQRIASGSYDRTVKIWDAATGECQQTFEAGRVFVHLLFDPITNTRLFTDMGLLTLDPSSAIDNQSPKAASGSIAHSGYGISDDGIWITKDGRSMLWLPPEYRTWTSTLVGSTVAIGCSSGRVLVMKFS
ncbi:WD40-repeat-containing domain protein, partial [Ilyonectria sp. MPI-CAGE-AT-0026]